MQLFLNQQSSINQKIKSQSRRIPKKNYPKFIFMLGMLMNNKIKKFETLFETFQSLYANYLQEYKINQMYFYQLFNALHKNPNCLEMVKDLMIQIDNKVDINVFLKVQQILQSFSDKQNSSNSKDNPLYRTGSKNTVVLDDQNQNSDKNNNNNNNKINNNNNAQKKKQMQIQQQQYSYTQEYFSQQQKQIKQSQQFARKLQQQQNALASKLNKPSDQAQCQICYVGLYDDAFTLLENCGHIFHSSCLNQVFKTNIASNLFPLKCPHDQCQAQIYESQIKEVLSKDLYEKYQQNTLKSYADVNGDTTSWCPTADCTYLFFYQKDDDPRFQCQKCKKEYCLNCRVQWHKDMSCKQYKVNSTTSAQDQKFLNFVKGKKFKQCPKCKFWVQKNQGCDHMTCKCKFQFCYKCGGIYMKCQCVQKAKQLQRQKRQKIQVQRKKKIQKQKQRKQKEKEQIKRPPTRSTRKRK